MGRDSSSMTPGADARTAARFQDIRNEQLLPEPLIAMAERVFPKMIFASRQTAVWTN
jgi:hypothetical protein